MGVVYCTKSFSGEERKPRSNKPRFCTRAVVGAKESQTVTWSDLTCPGFSPALELFYSTVPACYRSLAYLATIRATVLDGVIGSDGGGRDRSPVISTTRSAPVSPAGYYIARPPVES